MPGGTISSTKASPPEIKSARLERTRMSWLSSVAMAPRENKTSNATNQSVDDDLRLCCMNFLLEATWNRTCATARHSSIRRHEQAYAMDRQQIVNGKTIDWKKFQNGVMQRATRQTAAEAWDRYSLRQEPGPPLGLTLSS